MDDAGEAFLTFGDPISNICGGYHSAGRPILAMTVAIQPASHD